MAVLVVALVAGAGVATACDPQEDAEPTVPTVDFEPRLLVTVDGVNHLFVPADTGEIDEYALLQDKRVSPKAMDALVPWLRDKLHVGAAGAGR